MDSAGNPKLDRNRYKHPGNSKRGGGPLKGDSRGEQHTITKKGKLESVTRIIVGGEVNAK